MKHRIQHEKHFICHSFIGNSFPNSIFTVLISFIKIFPIGMFNIISLNCLFFENKSLISMHFFHRSISSQPKFSHNIAYLYRRQVIQQKQEILTGYLLIFSSSTTSIFKITEELFQKQ